MNSWRSKLFCLSTTIFLTWPCHATKINGRFYLGGYGATERFKETTGDSNTNDFMIASSRFFLKLSELGESKKWESTIDLRDSQDFFDKLDKERLQLYARNEFQVRQLYSRYVNPKVGFGGALGRFPVSEAGSVNVDGALTEWRMNSNWSSALFAGLNSKRVEQSYMQYNSDSTVTGAYLRFEPKNSNWNRNILLNHAFVNQKYKSETERRYFFHNLIYQWNENSRVISLAYVDFIPKTKVQTANLIWQQYINSRLENELDYLAMDVIDYTRKQNVLEQMSPSPYFETQDKLEFHLDATKSIGLTALSGKRSYDGLHKTEAALIYSHNQIWSPKWDLYSKLGTRKNFTSDDQFFKCLLGYFSRNWEINGILDYAIQKNIDTTITHPIITELNISSFISKSYSLTASLQRAADERLTILSAFLKFGYRFGNQEIPPPRDGAPPRGQL